MTNLPVAEHRGRVEGLGPPDVVLAVVERARAGGVHDARGLAEAVVRELDVRRLAVHGVFDLTQLAGDVVGVVAVIEVVIRGREGTAAKLARPRARFELAVERVSVRDRALVSIGL
jgi:hypothetical protein